MLVVFKSFLFCGWYCCFDGDCTAVVVVVCCRRETVGCCWIGASTAADEAVDAVEVVDEDFIRFVDDDDDVGCVC